MFRALAIATLIALAFPLSPHVFGQVADQQSSDTTTAKYIQALANELASAIVRRDVAAMEQLLADDYMDVNPDGVVSSRAQFIAEYNNPPAATNEFEAAEFGESGLKVRVYGDVAVLTGRSIWRGHTAEGYAFTGTLVSSMVAVKENGQWKIATTHSSSVPPSQAATNPPE
ncbi:nuclear transport factor 2 family protein [Pseudoxanthomonas sp. PXM01]|uniref:nuclear transport factor 2 family protein n=1 Tax=Pseudoxanthomonas sp. PXM01 TaxID=2769295 RepID=UPI001782A0E8|nr:nuclear transport factor 2 family protein [Pseudoxanthomonas sp. PXM01]MBD9470309.1 nuclear transport factor 2 family protein [Pseudoxanthomonas sp. PXM01]